MSSNTVTFWLGCLNLDLEKISRQRYRKSVMMDLFKWTLKGIDFKIQQKSIYHDDESISQWE